MPPLGVSADWMIRQMAQLLLVCDGHQPEYPWEAWKP
jgi:hypothetical protein